MTKIFLSQNDMFQDAAILRLFKALSKDTQSKVH